MAKRSTEHGRDVPDMKASAEEAPERVRRGNGAASAEEEADVVDDVTEDAESLDEVPAQAADAAALQIAELKDHLLRLAADFDNYRKRAVREQDDARSYGITQLLTDVLPVIDNLERALAHAEGDKHPIVEGVRLVLKQFADVLGRYGVQGFTSVGTPFDPERHDAVAQVASPQAIPGTVVEELQRGYTIKDRLLRAAKVVVATAAPEAADSAE